MSVRSELLERSLEVATEEGDSSPYDIEAVATTYGQAASIRHYIPATKYPERTPVYIVAMRGEWHGECHPPKGMNVACERTWLVVEFLAATMSQYGIPESGGENSYPNLATMGTPVELKPAASIPAEEALSATLVVHVTVTAPPGLAEKYPDGYPDEAQPLRINRLGSGRAVLSSLETGEHTIHVVPGTYDVEALDHGASLGSTTVAVSAEQQLEVKLGLDTE